VSLGKGLDIRGIVVGLTRNVGYSSLTT